MLSAVVAAQLWALKAGLKPAYLCDTTLSPAQLLEMAPDHAVVCLYTNDEIFGHSMSACLVMQPSGSSAATAVPSSVIHVGGTAAYLLPVDAPAVGALRDCQASVLARRVKGSVVEVDIPATCSLPALIGALLGYPVVYWTDPRRTANCLGDTALVVTRLSIAVPGLSAHDFQLVTKFSIPSALMKDCHSALIAWRRDLTTRLDVLADLTYQFQAETISVPIVAL